VLGTANPENSWGLPHLLRMNKNLTEEKDCAIFATKVAAYGRHKQAKPSIGNLEIPLSMCR